MFDPAGVVLFLGVIFYKCVTTTWSFRNIHFRPLNLNFLKPKVRNEIPLAGPYLPLLDIPAGDLSALAEGMTSLLSDRRAVTHL